MSGFRNRVTDPYSVWTGLECEQNDSGMERLRKVYSICLFTPGLLCPVQRLDTSTVSGNQLRTQEEIGGFFRK